MQEKNTVFKEIRIEPLTIYTQDKFKIKIKLKANNSIALTTEKGEILHTEDNKNIVVE